MTGISADILSCDYDIPSDKITVMFCSIVVYGTMVIKR